MAKTLIILVLLFDGTLIQERYDLAREMSDFNINVNCIAPGPIDTDLIKGVTERQIKKIIDRQIITKKFSDSAVADLVEILLVKKSRFADVIFIIIWQLNFDIVCNDINGSSQHNIGKILI